MRTNGSRSISVIIPTLGRREMLELCLQSIARQSVPAAEILVIHCGSDGETKTLSAESRWRMAGLTVRYFHYPECNVAQQRNFGILHATHPNILLVDDDVELETQWVAELFKPIWADPRVGATMGRLVNQPMPMPTPLWRIYRLCLHGKHEGFEPGRLIGAALPNGFPIDAAEPIPCEWIGGGVSALRRSAFDSVGGFAPYFTGSSPGEDLDLGYRLSRSWKVFYVPSARCIHHQAPSRREPVERHQYLSMRSRFAILTSTMGKGRALAMAHIALWMVLQCVSELASLRHGRLAYKLLSAWRGRALGWVSCMTWQPQTGHTATNRSKMTSKAPV